MNKPEISIPGAEDELVRSILSSPVPEFGDPGRAEIIAQISSELGIGMVDPSVRALLWLADVEALLALRDGCMGSRAAFRLLLGHGGIMFRDALTSWACDVFERWAEVTEDPFHLCRERDQLCVITRDVKTRTVNVYPHRPAGASNAGSRATLWEALGVFWGEPRVAGWRQAVFGCGCANKLGNTMLLRDDVSQAWASLHFALRPVELSRDFKSLSVQFFWLPGQQCPSDVPLLSPPAFGPDNTGGWEFRNPWNSRRLQSGDFLRLLTHDPERCPLPSFELLEIQWYLHRAAALSGLTIPPRIFLSDEIQRREGSDST
ncbi:hypothetical protein BO86DRAFT_440546 [Aspergillus japonicus CBS 114.51]|uniref:HNH nuclease domain-containing protein n=1 Tax=Aspergillus japonicus CBS 114.51 TaxID=1448312 RepID=A0A8T8XAZ2_ASPJA|nr:hypothetical protein BO86DRAFT_440546 [Aspergillus japonicus CBS 114.51]RAH85150.1 hypothetical protein BO86DRAFT_440546 [Aspergillus japonicus CBS 114.51]